MIDVTPFVKTLEGKPVAVFGIGESCLAAIKALKKAGADVVAWDDHEAPRKKGQKAGARIKPFHEHSMREYACLILAPGVPLTHPEPHQAVLAAQQAGLEVLCDIEILHRLHHGRKTIAVTGTNGKSTTTSLIGHILSQGGRKVSVGGNIGLPALAMKMPPQEGIIVLELSSFQLDLCPTFAPDIGIILNITPDHIDRHGSMEGYIASKKKLFRSETTLPIIGIDDEPGRALYEELKKADRRNVIPVSVETRLDHGIYVKEGILFDALESKPLEIGPIDNITRLCGAHNMQNAAAAYAAAKLAGMENETIYEALGSYPGLAYRQFPERIMNGVSYVNDSKATNAQATARALACHKNIYWIAGGRPKKDGLSGIEPYLDTIRHAYLIGEAAEDFADWIKQYGVPYTISRTLDRALEEASAAAQAARGEPGGAGCVLLSPACASFDQYESFEDRGNHFKKLVMNLPEDMAA